MGRIHLRFPPLHTQTLQYPFVVLSQPSGFSIVCCCQLQLWGVAGDSYKKANSPVVLFSHLTCYLGSCTGDLNISCSTCAPFLASLHRDFSVQKRELDSGTADFRC